MTQEPTFLPEPDSGDDDATTPSVPADPDVPFVPQADAFGNPGDLAHFVAPDVDQVPAAPQSRVAAVLEINDYGRWALIIGGVALGVALLRFVLTGLPFVVPVFVALVGIYYGIRSLVGRTDTNVSSWPYAVGGLVMSVAAIVAVAWWYYSVIVALEPILNPVA